MTAPTLLITGANGFVGSHVAAMAASRGLRVWAAGRETRPAARLESFCDEYFSRDLNEEWRIPEGADYVVHLAGLAAVGLSFDRPQRYISVNSSIMTNMCEAFVRQDKKPRIVVVSSGSVYAPPKDKDEALDESSPLIANSPYAVAKMLVENQAAYYSNRGLDTVVARPFNHIGPGQNTGFLVPDLTLALESLPVGEVMHAANLHAARDFTDVRDVANAYLTLALAPSHEHQTYNVASGVAHSGFDVLETLCQLMERPVPEVRIDSSKLRPTDPMRIAGNAERLRGEFGWEPEMHWKRSIADFLGEKSKVENRHAFYPG
ncbi:putative nucleoside-diphosphate sugar epimerases [Microbacterium sp. TS-1]|uniref:NAD-dependent epimerase/dehydratase family protein n=1 Tax=Microbacterium sp. TS-1 TaxID=1344956 RepID=UPI0003901572|nr:NAD-dependent epimerase/dehydratase family protein [Microbacterium sp. TS-1]GAD35043.1 putative nucleoside-diphosphate sugar epimerases [Microbacterium sp. TS-1]